MPKTQDKPPGGTLAVDDSYITKDFLSFDLSGIDNYLRIRVPDLLANDKGVTAKTFHSVDAKTSDGIPIIYDRAGQTLLIDAAAYQGLADGQTSEVTFKYKIQVGGGTLSEARVTLQVIGENDGPVANNMTLAATEHQPLTNILFQADDVDSDDGQASLQYQIVDSPTRGTITLNSNKFSFDPGTAFDGLAKNEVGTATFTYMATDRHGAASGTKTVTISVTGENDAPVAQASSASGYEDMPITAAFSADDVDSDDDQASLQYQIVDQPASGAVTVNTDGTFTFDPNGDFDHLSAGQEAQVAFTYRAVDRHGSVSSAETVALTIQGKENTPDDPNINYVRDNYIAQNQGLVGTAGEADYFIFGGTEQSIVAPEYIVGFESGLDKIVIVTPFPNDPIIGHTSSNSVDSAVTLDGGSNQVWLYDSDVQDSDIIVRGDDPYPNQIPVIGVSGGGTVKEGEQATFTFNRTGDFSDEFIVRASTPVGDHDIVFAEGEATATFQFSTVDDDIVQGDRFTGVSVHEDERYYVSSSASAVIKDNDVLPAANIVRDDMNVSNEGLVGTSGQADYFVATKLPDFQRYTEQIIGFESGLDKLILIQQNAGPWWGGRNISSESGDPGLLDTVVWAPGSDSDWQSITVVDVVLEEGDLLIYQDETLLPAAPPPSEFLLA